MASALEGQRKEKLRLDRELRSGWPLTKPPKPLSHRGFREKQNVCSLNAVTVCKVGDGRVE